MGVSAAVTMDTGMFIFSPTFTAVYQLSGWIKVWFILYPVIQLSGMAQEQRGPDNRGSTVHDFLSWIVHCL